jgi:hypothetical protein
MLKCPCPVAIEKRTRFAKIKSLLTGTKPDFPYFIKSIVFFIENTPVVNYN